jgi:RNA polymerase sigma factor (TIGR02999 family)
MARESESVPQPSAGSDPWPTGEALATTDLDALTRMMPELYDELRRLAGGYLRNERRDHTLQPTALVHEAYLRLAKQQTVNWKNGAQLLGIAARMMRRILINHAVARHAAKRGGENPVRMTLDAAMEIYDRNEVSLRMVDEALRELEVLDLRQAQIVELRFFGGLTTEEIAKALEISPAMVKREWAIAKLWLQRAFSRNSG